ncbi:MAG TPA: class I SAM-dependent methyltransferase [Gemmatimonadaceae bacterium]|nr:class I SAM-dependent methyltransferase [Gemmatimonadaceae bacterium]
MDPRDVAASYDRIADRWDDASFPRGNGIAAHERALAFLARGGRALDVGCGCSGRFIDLLLGRGLEVEGLDLSARMIALARRRHPRVTFHHADMREWASPQPYDFISAWDSLWHLPLADHERTLKHLLAMLAPGGVCLFTAGGLDATGDKTDAAMGVPMYYSTLGVSRMLAVIAEAGAACRHLEYDQLPEQHVYVIAQRVPPTPPSFGSAASPR